MRNLLTVNSKDTKTMLLTSFWCLYCQVSTNFTKCLYVSLVNSEQINASWECCQFCDYNTHNSKVKQRLDTNNMVFPQCAGFKLDGLKKASLSAKVWFFLEASIKSC